MQIDVGFVAIFRDLDPNYDVKRVCVKIPATWEGMQACRELEAQGIATLATTLFSMQQVSCIFLCLTESHLHLFFSHPLNTLRYKPKNFQYHHTSSNKQIIIQATLAAHVDCTLVAPYINELRVHFDEK